MQKFFNLQEGEKIVEEIKPENGLKWYFFFSGAGAIFIALLVLFGFFGFIIGFSLAFLLGTFIILIVPFSLAYMFAHLQYNKQFYWITNKRVVYKRGIVGYRITSIPHERISDAIISRTFWERLFGFGSLHIQSLAGQISGAGTIGSEGILLAVPDPESTQELIFKLIKTKRKEEHLSF